MAQWSGTCAAALGAREGGAGHAAATQVRGRSGEIGAGGGEAGEGGEGKKGGSYWHTSLCQRLEAGLYPAAVWDRSLQVSLLPPLSSVGLWDLPAFDIPMHSCAHAHTQAVLESSALGAGQAQEWRQWLGVLLEVPWALWALAPLLPQLPSQAWGLHGHSPLLRAPPALEHTSPRWRSLWQCRWKGWVSRFP